jgi:hypothetical protein
VIIIKGDYSSIESEFDRLEQLPDFKTTNALDVAHTFAFSAAQAAIHVKKGALKATGRKTSRTYNTKWVGTMRWGGAAKGGFVDYAIYEKARDDEHDWLNAVEPFEALYVAAMMRGLEK